MKPPYELPSMRDIQEARGTNGLTMVSTFSGCGGSCLGFEAAGYNLLWANEFVQEARDTYTLNHPGVTLDSSDIREIHGEDILAATGLKRGELDVLEGSPPCASFSTAGKREKDWGKVKKYSGTEQRTDDLFYDFARILGELQPRMFAAENVSGMVKGKALGYFKLILKELKDQGYHVQAKMLDASWLGVPQARQRLIIVGARTDTDLMPVFPEPLPYQYTVSDVLPNIRRVKKGGHPDNFQHTNQPVGTIVASDGQTSPTAYFSGGGFAETTDDITVDPETGREISISPYAIAGEWDKLQPGQSSSKYFTLVKAPIAAPAPTITATGGNIGAAAITHPTQRRKFTLQELRLLASFPADFQLTGTYEQRWERIGRSVPPRMAQHIATALTTQLQE